MSSGGCSTCLEIIFAAVLPPLGVFFRYGCCSSQFFISLLLTVLGQGRTYRVCSVCRGIPCSPAVSATVLGYIPGIVYSVYVILKTPPEPPGIDGERPYYILA